MAAFMRGVSRLVSAERSVFVTNRSGVVIESKRYVRGLRRKPVKVLFPENQAGKVVKPPPQPGVKAAAKPTERWEKSDPVKTRSQGESPQVNVVKDQLDGLRFERALPGDKRLSRLVSVARSRAVREHQGKILLEGRRLICDALQAGASPQTVFFSTVDRLRELPVDKLRRATLIKVKFEDIRMWSDLVAPQGVIAIFSRPDPARMNYSQTGQSVPLSLICDNIRDPGNLGTMLRSAAAAGCSKVLLTKGCVDIWEPKVLRAAMGAHFRLPVYPSLTWEDVEDHLPKAAIVHVADSGASLITETEENLPRKPGDYGWVSSRPNRKNTLHEEYDTDSDSDDEGISPPRVETKLYHESWARTAAALVIGGETHGLSHEAVRLAGSTDGHRLFIPVIPDVDSLNSAMAASVLLFEGRRQLLELLRTSGKKRHPDQV
uniref:Mitochondrial rRNA methyltransferase 3a n=1 Tax=Kryptolebias marmoratus TaxID=37003 RepID=A0A3Q3B8N0_KRYMA